MSTRITAFILAIIILFCPNAFGSVTGTISDTDGNPVSGTLVTFTDESNPDNYYIANTNSTGHYAMSITSVSVKDKPPASFNLLQNYPHPFNPSTSVEYTLDKVANVTVEVFSPNGQLVSTLVNLLKAPERTGLPGMQAVRPVVFISEKSRRATIPKR